MHQVEEAMEVLQKKYLHEEVKIEGLHRTEYLEYPESALREALVNAIVHRDYSAIHTQIRIYSDHFSIWNNGGLIGGLTIEKLKKKHSSHPRNELIADVLYKAGFIEKWGSGTVKIVDECKLFGLPEPVYEESDGGMLLTFLKDIYTSDNLKKLGLNERQIKGIIHLKDYGKISNQEYQKITGAIKRTSSRDLTELLEKKLLEKSGSTGKGTI
jgi:ATP-dependent DNA helicase RecG